MTTSELLRAVSGKTGFPVNLCERIYSTMVDILIKTLSEEEKVVLSRFITLEVYKIPPRKRKDINTGEVKMFPATKQIKHKLNRNFKNEVKRNLFYGDCEEDEEDDDY